MDRHPRSAARHRARPATTGRRRRARRWHVRRWLGEFPSWTAFSTTGCDQVRCRSSASSRATRRFADAWRAPKAVFITSPPSPATRQARRRRPEVRDRRRGREPAGTFKAWLSSGFDLGARAFTVEGRGSNACRLTATSSPSQPGQPPDHAPRAADGERAGQLVAVHHVRVGPVPPRGGASSGQRLQRVDLGEQARASAATAMTARPAATNGRPSAPRAGDQPLALLHSAVT